MPSPRPFVSKGMSLQHFPRLLHGRMLNIELFPGNPVRPGKKHGGDKFSTYHPNFEKSGEEENLKKNGENFAMKKMKRAQKLLAVLLSICMLSSLCVVGAAAEDTETLQSKINAADAGSTVVLDKDYTENITIAAGKNITLDLSGHALTGSTTGSAGIPQALDTQNQHTALVNKGTLTIVDNSTNKTGRVSAAGVYASALYNDAGATATLNGGTFTTSKVTTGTSTTQGSNWYVIRNHGTMTMNAPVKVITGGEYQLAGNGTITNGYEQMEVADKSETHLSTDAVMTINGGTYQSGIFVVKNGDWDGIMTINGGNRVFRPLGVERDAAVVCGSEI
jgi:hypothetical protein